MILFLNACHHNTIKMVHCSKIFIKAIALKSSRLENKIIFNPNLKLYDRKKSLPDQYKFSKEVIIKGWLWSMLHYSFICN